MNYSSRNNYRNRSNSRNRYQSPRFRSNSANSSRNNSGSRENYRYRNYSPYRNFPRSRDDSYYEIEVPDHHIETRIEIDHNRILHLDQTQEIEETSGIITLIIDLLLDQE